MKKEKNSILVLERHKSVTKIKTILIANFDRYWYLGMAYIIGGYLSNKRHFEQAFVGFKDFVRALFTPQLILEVNIVRKEYDLVMRINFCSFPYVLCRAGLG